MNTQQTSPLRCPAGTVIFTPGQACPGFVQLTRGTIRVVLTSAAGREVVLYRVRPGGLCLQTFSCLVQGTVYAATGIAESDLEGEIIPHAAFRRLMETDTAFMTTVLGAVAQRFADYEQLVEDVALTGFDARLARVLLRLADPDLQVMTTHDQLAAETASGRAFVSRRLAAFERDGLLNRHRGHIEITDHGRLARIAYDEG